MSVALSTIRTRVLNLLANHSMITSSDATALIQAEHVSILEDYSWSRRKAFTIVDTVATYSTGTVSTSGTTVTGSSTVFTSGMVDRFIRIGSNTYYHLITGFTSTTSLTVEQAPATAAAAGTSYTIFRHVYDLPSTFGRVTSVTLDTRLRESSASDIDRVDPYRSSTASRPDVYTIRGLDVVPTGVFQIEFWPVPSAAQSIRIEFLRTNTLVADTDQPLYRGDLLVWKAAESGAFFLLARTGDDSWLQLADRYHARYLEAFEGAKADDLGKYSAVGRVRDTWASGDRGDDWLLDHDPILLR